MTEDPVKESFVNQNPVNKNPVKNAAEDATSKKSVEPNAAKAKTAKVEPNKVEPDKADYHYAPGWPGIPPRWTSSAKSGVGTALAAESPVWFTLSHGILDEIYYPHEDFAAIRDLGLIVTDGGDFFSEEKRDTFPEVPYVKLRRSLENGQVFDLPPQTVGRYLEQNTGSPYILWRFDHQVPTLPQGRTLRVETLAPARVHWTADGWQTVQDGISRPTGLELHVTDLPTQDLSASAQVTFTFFWLEADRWEKRNFTVTVAAAEDRTLPLEAAEPKRPAAKKQPKKQASKKGETRTKAAETETSS